ncbi:MAG: MFS transporter, partial [Salinibacterium sp.]|nr:MFS transporter [Salinibacterium sp.]
LAAIPLARLAQRSGRSISLSAGAGLAAVGAVLAVIAAANVSLPLLFIGSAMIGMGNAANLQARFAATDLAVARNRGRDLSIVVWSTTVGAVIGPNLLAPGERLGASLGLPPLTGVYAMMLVTQLLAVVLYLVALRPDPLVLAARLKADDDRAAAASGKPIAAQSPARNLFRFALVALALSHATMVAVMAMTPVHLTEHGASLTIVGITISLHVAGMYALAPVFGILADRIGRVQSVLVGQGILLAGVSATGFGAESQNWVTVGLVLIGLGWSCATISASALVTESSPLPVRTRNQGRSDLAMSLSGAVGGGLAGVVLAFGGYSGLSLAAGVLVVSVILYASVVRVSERTKSDLASQP